MPLVLTRKPMQAIHIGDDIIVTLVSIENGKARIAIEAPRDVAIIREELLKSHHHTRGSVMQSFKARMQRSQREGK